MIPYGRQTIDASDRAAVDRALQSDWLTQGPRVLEFERTLARYCGARYAVSCANGTAALHLAYLATGLGAGDEVITTPNTFVATTNMLITVGARPIFCDIRLDTYNLDEKKIAALITKKTKAIVPVHFAGQPCALGPIARLAKKHRLVVIEDACHALGARYRRSPIGNGRYSDMAVFSFHPVKPVTTGEGGAITTNSKVLYDKLKLLRSHGIVKDQQGISIMHALGFNYRLTDLQAALGTSQLKKIDRFIRNRRQLAAWYQRALADIPGIITPQEDAGNYSGWHLYVIRLTDPRRRNDFLAFLKRQGIGANLHYPAVYAHPYYQSHGFKNSMLKNEQAYARTTATIPCYPGLTQREATYIVKTIRRYFKAL